MAAECRRRRVSAPVCGGKQHRLSQHLLHHRLCAGTCTRLMLLCLSYITSAANVTISTTAVDPAVVAAKSSSLLRVRCGCSCCCCSQQRPHPCRGQVAALTEQLGAGFIDTRRRVRDETCRGWRSEGCERAQARMHHAQHLRPASMAHGCCPAAVRKVCLPPTPRAAHAHCATCSTMHHVEALIAAVMHPGQRA